MHPATVTGRYKHRGYNKDYRKTATGFDSVENDEASFPLLKSGMFHPLNTREVA